VFKGHQHIYIASLLPNQTIIVGGISKEISGTGLRLGFVAGPAHVVHATADITGHTVSCNNLPIQLGYMNFLKSDKDMKQRLHIRDILEAKADIFYKLCCSLPGLSKCRISEPQGAFYFFPDISKYIGLKIASKENLRSESDKIIKGDDELAEFILKEAGVVCLAGSKFGKPGYLRFAFAAIPVDQMKLGLHSLSNALLRLY